MDFFRRHKKLIILVFVALLGALFLHPHVFSSKVHPECVTCASAQQIVISTAGLMLLVGLSFLTCVAIFQKEYFVQALHFRFFLRAPPQA